MDRQQLEQVVRGAVEAVLGKASTETPVTVADTRGASTAKVVLVKGTEVGLKPFAPVPGVDSRLADYVTSAHGAAMAAGLMEIRDSAFDWTLNYEEIDYVLEGTLDIVVGDQTYRGYKGDAIFIPKGTSIKFSSPDRALFFYVTFPADWANQ